MNRAGADRETLFGISFLAISLCFFPVLLQAALFVLGVPMSAASFAVGLTLGICAPLVLLRRGRPLLFAYLTVAVVMVVALAVLGSSWDNSHDSLTYHVPAAISLAAGTNPVNASLGQFWADHYPKAAWILSGGAYALGGSVEYGKVVTALLALACFGFAGVFFLSIPRFPTRWAYVLAALSALNPVVIVQLDTHYVDGLFACLATILVLIALALGPARLQLGVPVRLVAGLGVASAILLANLKFTGLVLVAALVGIQLVWSALRDRRELVRTWKSVALALAAIALGTLLVGFSPYITNLMGYSNPLYPLFSADLRKIADPPDSGQRPAPYRDKAVPVAFLMSLTEKTSAATTETMEAPYRLKNPFWVSFSEVAGMEFPDPRRGGYGPLFLLATLLAICLFALMVVRRRSNSFALPLGVVSYAVVLLTLLTFLMLEAWWARLAPLFFLVPVMIAAGGLSATGTRSRLIRALSMAVVLVLCLNGLIALAAQAFDYRNRQATKSLAIAALQGADEVSIRFPDPWVAEMMSVSLSKRLQDQGLAVKIVPASGQQAGTWVYYPALLAEVRIEP